MVNKMPNKEKRAQLRRMFRWQNGRCFWCGVGMVPPGTHAGKGRPDPKLCTFDHMDDRFSDERGKHPGKYRNVAACWTCNNNRAAMQQANVSKKVLWEKSGAYPRELRDAREGATGLEQLFGQREQPEGDSGARDA